MVVGKIGRCAAALMLVGFVAAGCTPDAPSPPSSPTPPPTPSVSQIPSETAQERQQRVDYEAAEKSYRAFRAEYRRVLRDGGAENATARMRATAGNGYLKDTENVIQGYKSFKYRQEGQEKIVYLRPGGYSPSSLILDACEDDRSVKAMDENGKSLGPGEFRVVKIVVAKRDGSWKLWSGTGKKVDSCG